jgi:Protein of unknown function (DUF3352)
MRSFMTIALALLLAPVVTFGQALVDHVPGDAEIYFGWSGIDSPVAGYDQSHLKALLDSSQVSQFFEDSLPRLIDHISQADKATGQKIRAHWDALAPLVAHPCAFYFGGMDSAGGPPMPKIAFICDAGADADKIQNQLNQLITGQHVPMLHVQTSGTLVIVSDYAFPDHADSPLSQNASYQSAMAQVGKDAVFAVYVDGTALMATINQAVQQFAPPPAQQTWPQISASLGLDGFKAFAATDSFDGKNWSTQAFLNAPAPRHGILAGDFPPISEDLINLIPQSSTMAGACTCDLNALFTAIDQAIVQFAPDQGNQFHQAIAQINQAAGIDIQKDLLAQLGSQWGYYVDPATAGTGVFGVTIVNRPRNADALQNSLASLENAANADIKQQIGPSALITVEFRQMTSNGATIHYLATPLFSPSWSIKNGTLFVGLFPQMAVSAVNRPADAKSIRENPDFQAIMTKLNAPSGFASFSYYDLPRTMPVGYQSWLMMARLYLGYGDLFGSQTPPLMLPPLDQILAETEPSGAASWVDDAGFHLKSIQPFPGANAMGTGDSMMAAGVGQSALMASIMLPSLNRARETANRVKCASNMQQIGQAILLYSNDQKGAYPPDLGTLVKTEDITAAAFICPSSGEAMPPDGMTPEQSADWVNAHTDYIYLGAGLKQRFDATIVVCYEKDGDHGGDGMNLLFGDGHTEFRRLADAHRVIADSLNKLHGGGGGNNPGGGAGNGGGM